MAAALLLLCACGGFENDPLRKGDVVGRVLRGSHDTGRVVLMGPDPVETGLDSDGTFHFHSIPSGAQELLVVASDAEALRVPLTVGPAELTDLQDLDPLPAAFIVINLTTAGVVQDCWVKVYETDLREVHAPDGTARFVAGPLGAGRYDASMVHKGDAFWTQTKIDLQPGEQRAFDVSW